MDRPQALLGLRQAALGAEGQRSRHRRKLPEELRRPPHPFARLEPIAVDVSFLTALQETVSHRHPAVRRRRRCRARGHAAAGRAPADQPPGRSRREGRPGGGPDRPAEGDERPRMEGMRDFFVFLKKNLRR